MEGAGGCGWPRTAKGEWKARVGVVESVVESFRDLDQTRVVERIMLDIVVIVVVDGWEESWDTGS